jgi:hypothetical protein
MTELPPAFKLFFDLRTEEDLVLHLSYLRERLKNIEKTCDDYGIQLSAVDNARSHPTLRGFAAVLEAGS